MLNFASHRLRNRIARTAAPGNGENQNGGSHEAPRLLCSAVPKIESEVRRAFLLVEVQHGMGLIYSRRMLR
jgi:hypothetical protein